MPKTKTIEATKTIDRGPRKRTVRVPDDLWSAAMEAAAPQLERHVAVDIPAGEGLPGAIRLFLEAYVNQVAADEGHDCAVSHPPPACWRMRPS